MSIPAPKLVSPFIRFCRWSFFLGGIAYGHYHLKHLSKREIPILKVNTEIIDRRKEDAHKIAQLKELEEMHEVGLQLGWGPEETERQLGIGRFAKNAHHAAAPAGDAHAAPAAHH
jgi:hypothetical protein